MRFLTLAAIAALGLAACAEQDTADDNAAATADTASNYSADAAADAARDASTTTRTVIVPDTDRDNDGVTVQVGPDGPRVNATVDTD